jgi:hypothetical protein
MTYTEIKINLNSKVIGYCGLILNILGLFLPWLNVFYYYDYYYPWEFIGLFGIGIFSVIGSFFAFFGLIKKSKIFLTAAGLFNVYNAGGVIVFLIFCFLPEAIGIGAVICLIAGLLLVVAAFLPTDMHDLVTNHWNQTATFNKSIDCNTSKNIVVAGAKSNTNGFSFPLDRYCRFCGKEL